MTTALKPPFAYYGGKITLAPAIAALLPPHSHYVEPFAGSLAVLLAKPPSNAETVNDLDGDLVAFWRVLRDRPDELERACQLTPHSRAEFATSWEPSTDELEQARRVWVRLTQSRGKTLRRTGWGNQYAAPNTAHIPSRLHSFANRIPTCAQRLTNVTLENRDALDLIRDYGSEPTVLIYADPPYLGSTRTTGYRVEMRDDQGHETLATALQECKATVVLSGYASPLYERLFDGWHRLDMAGATTLSGDTDRVETLWSNRPLAQPDLFTSHGVR